MNDELDAKQMNDEINALSTYFSNRELSPIAVASMCAAAVGEIIGRNRHLIGDDAAEQMLQAAIKSMRDVAFAERTKAH